MTKNDIILIAFFLSYSMLSGAQVIPIDNETTLYKKLNKFIQNEEDVFESENYLICHKHLLDSNFTKDFGIYSFGIWGLHYNVYLYIKNKNGEIEIVKDYSIRNIIQTLNKFFIEYGDSLSEDESLKYSINAFSVLKQRNILEDDLKLKTLPSDTIND